METFLDGPPHSKCLENAKNDGGRNAGSSMKLAAKYSFLKSKSTASIIFSSLTWLKESLFRVSSRCLQKVITSQGCQTQQWCRPMRAHVKLVILSVPFPEVQNRKGTESGRCQRTFKEYRHSKILVPIPTCGIFHVGSPD